MATDSALTQAPIDPYVESILAHSKRTKQEHHLHSGENYFHLAHFLTKPWVPPPQSSQTAGHISLVTISAASPAQYEDFDGVADLDRFRAVPLPAGPSECQIVFIRGFTSPAWVRLLLSKYRASPEFFRRHLPGPPREYLQGPFPYFDTPPLPSGACGIAQLSVPNTYRRSDYPGSLDAQRKWKKSLSRYYTERLYSDSHGLHKTIVRHVHFLDGRNFALSKDISICIETMTDGGWVALVWLDDGCELLMNRIHGPPWATFPRSTRDGGNPVFQLRGEVTSYTGTSHIVAPLPPPVPPPTSPGSVDSSSLASTVPHATDANSTVAFRPPRESCSNLPQHFADSANDDPERVLMTADALYCLRGLFQFAAAAERQFLNRLEQGIDTPIKNIFAPGRGFDDLHEAREAVEHHAGRLRRTLQLLESGGGEHWPRPRGTGDGEGAADRALLSLKADYAELLRQAAEIEARIMQSVATISAIATLRESQRAVAQGDAVHRLTLLAFFFIPLSFVSSLFGMNVRELDSNSDGGGGLPSIWVPFVSMIPGIVVAAVLGFWDKIWPKLLDWVDDLITPDAWKNLFRD